MTIAELLSKTKADDYFIVNIRKGRERIYFGYAHEVADEVAVMKIESIYIVRAFRHLRQWCRYIL